MPGSQNGKKHSATNGPHTSHRQTLQRRAGRRGRTPTKLRGDAVPHDNAVPHDRRTRWLEAFPMAEANATNCANAMVRGWVQRFGIPSLATTDNGNTFIANIWKQVHDAIGIEVAYTPPYHSSSLGGVERQHKDLKTGLKASLMDMGDHYGEKWMDRLPWVLLGRRTTYQPALKATPAEMVLGSNPTVPGDVIGIPGPPLEGPQLREILDGLRRNAARPAVQTTHNRTAPINYPNLDNVTHVYVKKGKTTPLGHSFDGPFEITERLGKSCIKLKVGLIAKGEVREEIQHWSNCKPAVRSEDMPEATRARRGRKPLNPEATPFKPAPKQATQKTENEQAANNDPQATEAANNDPPTTKPATQQATDEPPPPSTGPQRRSHRVRRKPVRYQ